MPDRKCKVLCVEDHDDSREILNTYLGWNGFEVRAAADATSALALAKSEPFDVFVLDNMLPDSSGIELCKDIRSFDAQTPIIFYSALGAIKDQAEGMAAGAQAYLTKPQDLDKLADLIKILAPVECTTYHTPTR